MSRPWTDERIALLHKLWQDGLSCSVIANVMGGVTRNAVIGKLHRSGLQGRGAVKDKKTIATKAKGRPAPAPRSPRVKLRSDGIVAPYFAPTPLPIEPPAALDPATNCTLIDLAAGQCKWPLGDPRDEAFRFCGAPQTQRLRPTGGTTEICPSPYCQVHHALAYSGIPKPKGDDRTRIPPARRNSQHWGANA